MDANAAADVVVGAEAEVLDCAATRGSDRERRNAARHHFAVISGAEGMKVRTVVYQLLWKLSMAR